MRHSTIPFKPFSTFLAIFRFREHGHTNRNRQARHLYKDFSTEMKVLQK